MLAGQSDTDLMQLKIDIQQEVKHCEVYYIEDDKLYQVENPVFEGSQVTLYLKEYKDYEIVVNYHTIISITPRAYDIVDERDLDVSVDGEYYFKKGILMFDLYTADQAKN
jgi:hypothetical protein